MSYRAHREKKLRSVFNFGPKARFSARKQTKVDRSFCTEVTSWPIQRGGGSLQSVKTLKRTCFRGSRPGRAPNGSVNPRRTPLFVRLPCRTIHHNSWVHSRRRHWLIATGPWRPGTADRDGRDPWRVARSTDRHSGRTAALRRSCIVMKHPLNRGFISRDCVAKHGRLTSVTAPTSNNNINSYGGDTQSRNLHKFLAQVSCIKFSSKFMQVRLTTDQIKTGVLGRNK